MNLLFTKLLNCRDIYNFLHYYIKCVKRTVNKVRLFHAEIDCVMKEIRIYKGNFFEVRIFFGERSGAHTCGINSTMIGMFKGSGP